MAADGGPGSEPAHRVRICRIAGRYLIFDVKDVAYLRRHQNMSPVFVGTLPQNPNQNLFLGLPIELYAEEAKLLVDRGVGYVVDDAVAHLSKLSGLNAAEKRTYVARLREKQREMQSALDEGEARKKAMAEEMKRRGKDRPQKKKGKKQVDAAAAAPAAGGDGKDIVREPQADDDSLFSSTTPERETVNKAKPPQSSTTLKSVSSVYLTPTTSTGLVGPDDDNDDGSSPQHLLSRRQILAPPSSHLYKYLHARGYHMMPGLRFGADYNVYPGDPFRFHAHFLAASLRWDEEIPVLDLIARGRLGTSVKKSFLFGGLTERPADDEDGVGAGTAGDGVDDNEADQAERGDNVRVFCLEWAAM